MVQQPKETRRCVICGSTDIYCDVYDSKTIVQYAWPRKSDIAPPKHYCESHFFSEVWDKGNTKPNSK